MVVPDQKGDAVTTVRTVCLYRGVGMVLDVGTGRDERGAGGRSRDGGHFHDRSACSHDATADRPPRVPAAPGRSLTCSALTAPASPRNEEPATCSSVVPTSRKRPSPQPSPNDRALRGDSAQLGRPVELMPDDRVSDWITGSRLFLARREGYVHERRSDLPRGVEFRCDPALPVSRSPAMSRRGTRRPSGSARLPPLCVDRYATSLGPAKGTPCGSPASRRAVSS